MSASRPNPGVLRERLFLGFGLGSALVLVLAAFAAGGDPESAGRAELVSTAARIAEAVKAEWRDWPSKLGSPASRQELVPNLMHWYDTPLPFIEGHGLVPASDAGNEVFDALFAQAGYLELVQSDPRGAFELVHEAMAKTQDPARQAEARLRGVQLAQKCGENAWVLDELHSAYAQFDGSERKGDISYLLLCILAADRTLRADSNASELARAREWLDGSRPVAWILPPPDFVQTPAPGQGWAIHDDQAGMVTLFDALRSPVSVSIELGPERTSITHPEGFLQRARTGQALARLFGSVPSNQHDQLRFVRAHGAWLAHWGAIGLEEGGFVADATVRKLFLQACKGAAIAPDGFVVDVDPPGSGAKAVREHDSLDGDFGFTVKHEDPEGWIKKSAVKQRFFRGALLVLALLSAAAGVATFRALRRERTLATLKTDFVANVSHELRTPLASILLLSENLEAGRVKGAADQARYHSLIRREALRLRRLVDDVLDFSRLERGKRIDIRREPLRVDPWVERTFEELAEWAREHALELSIARSPTEAEAEIDAEALRRALLNLLDNARKHSGGTQVELSAASEGRNLVLSVRDHGRGISAEDRERVFEPFTRLAHGDAPGAGLGLSIVREIAREHGGTVRALEPESGPGIVFQMRIPLAEETNA